MKKIFVLVTGLFWAVCCGRQQSNVVSVGVDEAVAVTDTIRMSSVESELPVLSPVRLFVAENHLVLYQSKVEKRFQIYDLPLTGKCFSAGMIGRGPNEFINPDVMSITGNQSGFCLADEDSFKTVDIDIADSTIKVVSKTALFTEGAPNNGIIKVKDNYLNLDVNSMVPGLVKEGTKQYQVIGENGVEKHICDMPAWDDNNQNLIRYVSQPVAAPGKDIFAAFYGMFRKIRYYNLEGELLREVSADFPDQSVHADGKFYRTYSCPVASKDRIVVGCSNYSYGESVPEFSEFQIWDWKGNLVHRLIVPMKNLTFTVDFSTGMFYAISSGSEEELLYCDISEYL